MKGRSGLILPLVCCAGAWGQSAISAHSGMVHYVEGTVLLEGQPVDPKFGEFPDVKNDQVLQTKDGRAEVLLTPGVFLRLAEDSSFKMLSNRLSDTAIEVLSGSVMFEVDELLKDNAITVRYKDSTVALTKDGLYRVDSDPAYLKVYEGAAQVIYGTKTVDAHKGRQVALDGTLLASSFDTKDTDAFYRWASRRSEYIAAANVSSARSAGCSNSFATSTGCSGLGGYGYGSPYGNPYGMWSWNPYFGMFTYVPGIGFGYNPFGWAFYSPYTVGMLYYPGYYGNYGYPGAPVYTRASTGPTGLAGAKPTLGTTNNIGSPLHPNGNLGTSTASNSGSSSGGVRSGGTLTGGGSSLGGARSVGGGGHK